MVKVKKTSKRFKFNSDIRQKKNLKKNLKIYKKLYILKYALSQHLVSINQPYLYLFLFLTYFQDHFKIITISSLA